MTTMGTTIENKKALEKMNTAIANYANECAAISGRIERLEQARDRLNGYGWIIAGRKERTNYVGNCLQDDGDWKGFGKNIARLNLYFATEDWKRMDQGREFVLGYINSEIERLKSETNLFERAIGNITNDIKELERAIRNSK